MRLPEHPVPITVLEQYINGLHNWSPIQFTNECDSMGTGILFSTALTTDLVRHYFPNGSHLSGQLPHRAFISPQSRLNVLSISNRNKLGLGCIEHNLESFDDLIQYVSEPKNKVQVASVYSSDHAFNIVSTDHGLKIADVQYDFMCDPDDFESILKVASGEINKKIGEKFKLLNISEHDPTFSHTLKEFDHAIAEFSTTQPVIKRVIENTRPGVSLKNEVIQDLIFNSLTDPRLLQVTSGFDSFGHRYVTDEQFPDKTTAIEIDANELELKSGQWLVGIGQDNGQHIYLGTSKGICHLEPHKAEIVDTKTIDTKLNILASSKSLDLSGYEYTPYIPSTLVGTNDISRHDINDSMRTRY